jgi:hypothetical protein
VGQCHQKISGIKFLINGEVHYGWARLSITKSYYLLTGYAYETVANKAIPAGEEGGADGHAAAQPAELMKEPASPMATLGMMARGAGGLELWRREEDAA